MRSGNRYLLYITLLTAAIGGVTGCRKENGIVNNNVIRTPYSLYFSDKGGTLYNTNDGKAFKVVFPFDGVTARAVTTSGKNILWIKRNLHLSADNGLNFNPSNINVSPQAMNQSMILDVPSHGRVYLASTKTGGIEFSEDNGITWRPDISFAGTPAGIQSFTQLKNGKVYALDNSGPTVYERTSGTGLWTPVASTAPLPAGNYFLSHFNNALIAADVTGTNGLFNSGDGGVTWVPYAGIPTNQEIFTAAAPFEQVLLVGTDSAGIYRLVGDTLRPSNNGLAPFTKVYGIVGKQDTYKNDIILQYVYIATSKGLFRSVDLGQNWTLIRPGDYRVIN